jgi:hypothetical protein
MQIFFPASCSQIPEISIISSDWETKFHTHTIPKILDSWADKPGRFVERLPKKYIHLPPFLG